MNEYLSALILGVVEGITEFLPISSTGHLILVNQVVGFTGSFANMFDVVIQLGAILSVVVYFWYKLYPFRQGISSNERHTILNLWQKTLIGVLPALILGAAFGDIVEEHLFTPQVVAISLLVGGVVLVAIERRRKRSHINTIAQLSYRTAFFIGLIQCLAMIPGTSRSASTIIGAMLLGTSRVVAAEFSFFLAIPTMVAASGYTLLKTGLGMSLHQFSVLALGFVVSFFVAWLVIAAFMQFISKRNFIPFGYYRIALGILLLLYFGFAK